jgi:hypothetical protein
LEGSWLAQKKESTVPIDGSCSGYTSTIGLAGTVIYCSNNIEKKAFVFACIISFLS